MFDQQPDPESESGRAKDIEKDLGSYIPHDLNKALDLTHVPDFCGFECGYQKNCDPVHNKKNCKIKHNVTPYSINYL